MNPPGLSIAQLTTGRARARLLPGARQRFVAAIVAIAALALAGCSTNPATGQQAFTLLSPANERALGREQHPRVLAEFGGVYEDPAVQAYVVGIGSTLADRSEQAALPFTFTVLDSAMVNAFALPGGYVYVTRGLMALADSEAELAGVIGHEIGHVTARHGAQQHGRSVLVGLGAGIAGILTGKRGVADSVSLGGGLLLRGYSRDQEFEADLLGVRYMTRAGYDPDAMASFLGRLREKAKLDAKVLGVGSDPDERSLISSHPRTIDRVKEARAAILGAGPVDGLVDREGYLRRIEGMIYGDSPEQGFVRGYRFVHPELRFEFTVPPDFTLVNGQTAVKALSPNGAVIVFDMAPTGPAASALDYVRHRWGARLALVDLTRLTIDGMEAATGVTRVSTERGPFDLRLVAISPPNGRMYRFLFGTPAQDTARQTPGLQRTALGFRRLDGDEAASERPYRIRLYTAKPGDTVASLATMLPKDANAGAVFRMLNGLPPGTEPTAGRLLKYVGY